MFYITMLTLRKASTSIVIKYITDCKFISTKNINLVTKPQLQQFCKNIHLNNVQKNVVKPVYKVGVLKKLSWRFDLFRRKYQLIALGYHLYEEIPDRINYPKFFKDFNMPDTFYSWFLITELHVWMLMVRFMAEGETGKLVITNLVEAMWQDVLIRVDLIGPMPPGKKKKDIRTLSQQFNAALICYDEGIMSEDKVLAGALWARFFGLECNNPEYLEKLLFYVRKQTSILDAIPSEKLFHRSTAQWIDLQNIK